MTDHPCLCDICLQARDAELARARKAMHDYILQDIIGEDEMVLIDSYSDGERDSTRNGLREAQRERLEKDLGKWEI